jgi:hypothetical protein
LLHTAFTSDETRDDIQNALLKALKGHVNLSPRESSSTQIGTEVTTVMDRMGALLLAGREAEEKWNGDDETKARTDLALFTRLKEICQDNKKALEKEKEEMESRRSAEDKRLQDVLRKEKERHVQLSAKYCEESSDVREGTREAHRGSMGCVRALGHPPWAPMPAGEALSYVLA